MESRRLRGPGHANAWTLILGPGIREREQDEQEADERFQSAARHRTETASTISPIIITNPAGAGSNLSSCL